MRTFTCHTCKRECQTVFEFKGELYCTNCLGQWGWPIKAAQ